jgi:hypothetical protein
LNEENQLPITTDPPLLLTLPPPPPSELSSSLSELDPMLNHRPRTPSPIPSPIIDEQIMTKPSDEQIMTNSIDEKSSLTETLEPSPPIVEKPALISAEDSINISKKTEPSLSLSMNGESTDFIPERKNEDLFQIIQVDSLDIS